MKAAIYARVSTADQHNEIQIRELTEYADRRIWEVASVYQDTMSGAKAKRPGLDRLMADAGQRRFDVVLVWKLDRFGRSVVDFLNNVRELGQHGVRFMAVTQNIDTDEGNPAGRFNMNILAAVAEFERELIRERVNAGLKLARARGKRLGRPRKVFARYQVAQLRRDGLSLRQIARRLNVGEATVRRVLRAA
jgi:putative DNA-invertase from lambdoid prophage Rac